MTLSHCLVEARGSCRARLVILHSNGMCGAFYRPLMERLAESGIRSVAFDLPGFAAPAPAVLGWDGLIDAVEPEVREALGEDGVLVGHSLGGLLALFLAPRLSLRSLVLMEPAIVPWRWLARVAAGVYVRRVFDGAPGFTNRGPWFWRLHDPESYDPEWFALAAASHARADRAAVAALHGDLPNRYPLPFDGVRAPVTVVRGASSGRVMALGQRDLVRRLPSAGGVVIPGAGHWMVHEQNEALAAVLVRAAAGR